MSQVICPICGKQFDSTSTDAMPFCGKRCRQIDLGRWLGESYSFPASRRDLGDEESAEPPREED